MFGSVNTIVVEKSVSRDFVDNRVNLGIVFGHDETPGIVGIALRWMILKKDITILCRTQQI